MSYQGYQQLHPALYIEKVNKSQKKKFPANNESSQKPVSSGGGSTVVKVRGWMGRRRIYFFDEYLFPSNSTDSSPFIIKAQNKFPLGAT